METKNISGFANLLQLLGKLVRYNMRIIFANRFIWFFLASLGFFIFISINSTINGSNLDEEMVYYTLLFPGILLIFYPMSFGIQNDVDAGILEILFGIPDYRYKVWLVRLVLVFILVFLIMCVYSILASIFLTPVNILEMTYQVMYPILFIGTMSFMFSSLIKNGYGTMAVMVILGVILLIISEDIVENTQWDVFLNPFNIPRNLNETIWEGITVKNRIFISVSSLIFLLYGLFNLQKRERFI